MTQKIIHIGIVGGTGPVNTQETFTDAQVEEAVVQEGCTPPKYPPALKSVGVQGSVQLQYVVGTDGKVERSSVKVVSSTNKAFEEPAIDAILSCSSVKAAKIRGQPVRQLVERVVRFTIT